MKKKVLIIYYSQCGQTKKALEGLSSELEKSYEITNLEIQPKNEYEFPWKMTKFFRAFPRCVKEDYPEIQELSSTVLEEDYDLVVLGYQIWFLSPSLPILSLVNNPAFAATIKGKNVVGVVTSRNMWISGVGAINKKLISLGANTIKNLVLCDTGPAWATFVTTPRWMLTGKKEAFSIFPEAGIAQEEFKRANLFASLITDKAADEDIINCSHLQTDANIAMEKIGRVVFRCWTGIIYRLTQSDGHLRDFLLVLFRLNLVTLILVFLPTVPVYLLIRGKKQDTLLRNLLIHN
jgi:hypothetical protein